MNDVIQNTVYFFVKCQHKIRGLHTLLFLLAATHSGSCFTHRRSCSRACHPAMSPFGLGSAKAAPQPQPPLAPQLHMGFLPCLLRMITTVTIGMFKTVRLVIRWRQKCCSAGRNSCSSASSLAYRWLRLLHLLMRYKGNQDPPTSNTTGFLPTRDRGLVLFAHSFQKLSERDIGREKADRKIRMPPSLHSY